MQEIIENLAIIKAYNNYKARNITLSDGSTIAWNTDAQGNTKIKLSEFDANFALQNADNALREMAEFWALLEVFKQRENFSANSFFNENNFKCSENLSKNAKLQG